MGSWHWYRVVLSDFPFILTGVKWTVLISLGAMVGGSSIGIIGALARTSNIYPLRMIFALYVDVCRTIPLLVQLVWFYYVIPIITGLSLTGVEAAIVGLSLYEGSYLLEIFRGGILSLPRGQREAALALGMTPLKAARRVVLPQAIRSMMPAAVNILMTLVKDSSLVSIVAVPDLLYQTESISSIIGRDIEPLNIAAALYLVLTYPLSLLSAYLQRRFAVGNWTHYSNGDPGVSAGSTASTDCDGGYGPVNYHWSFSLFWNTVFQLMPGLLITVLVTIAAMPAGMTLAVPVCMARLSKSRLLRLPARVYIDFLRGTPLLLQIVWTYYSLALIANIVLTAYEAALLAFTLNLGAYMAEIFRSGIQSISHGQHDAAQAIGMTRLQAFRRVILPQAFRVVIPPLGSTWVGLFKDTALVSVIGLADVMERAENAAVNTARPVEIYTAAALLYLVVTYPQARAVDWIYRKVRAPL